MMLYTYLAITIYLNSAPVLGRKLHSQSVPPFVPRKRLPDWASPDVFVSHLYVFFGEMSI